LALAVKIRHGAEWSAFHLVRGLCLSLGVDRASALSGWLWRRIAPLNRRHQRAAKHLRQSLPDLSEAEIKETLAAMWDNLGRTMAEAFFLERIATEPGRVILTPAAQAMVERARRDGAVMVSGHMGNWELGAAILWKAGLDVCGIFRHVNSPVIDKAVFGLRAKFYRGGLWRKSRQAALQSRRAVEEKKTLILLCDLRDAKGVVTPFFSRPAPSTTFPALMAREGRAPLFATHMRRTKGAYFEIDADEIAITWSTAREADIAHATTLMQEKIETYIRRARPQWMWAHRRWLDRD
jgi:Kdo2-lipid IVA lauroyltransferase/acyltransferase